MGNHLKPDEMLARTSQIGQAKAASSLKKLLILGLLAGAFIAFAAHGSNMAAMGLLSSPETYGLGRLVAGVVFTPGLILVLLAGAELFTGDVLMIIPTLEGKISVFQLLRVLVLVYLANCAGGLLISWMMHYSGLFAAGGGMLGATTVKIATAKTSLTFGKAVVLGILCNWLVCLGVWMSFGTDSTVGKMLSAFFPVCLFVAGGFEHSIANMYYIPAGLLAKETYGAASGASSEALASLTWGGFLENLLPVTMGNLLGGMVFVGVAYLLAYGKKGKA